MRYQIGDLVSKRQGTNFGVVVHVDKANATSLMTSTHSQQYLKNSTDIYYVFFAETGKEGPYYSSELSLKQSSNGTTIY